MPLWKRPSSKVHRNDVPGLINIKLDLANTIQARQDGEIAMEERQAPVGPLKLPVHAYRVNLNEAGVVHDLQVEATLLAAPLFLQRDSLLPGLTPDVQLHKPRASLDSFNPRPQDRSETQREPIQPAGGRFILGASVLCATTLLAIAFRIRACLLRSVLSYEKRLAPPSHASSKSKIHS